MTPPLTHARPLPRAHALLLGLLAACGDKDSTGTESDDTSTGAEEDSALPEAPYLGEDTTTEEPAFDASEVSLAVADALEIALQIDASPIIGVYSALMQGADDDCPQWTEYDGYPTWLDTCTSDAGTQFDGYGVILEWNSTDLDGSGIYWSGYQLYSISTLSTSTGDTLTLGGDAAFLYGTSVDGVNAFYSYIGEGTRWEGAETGTWLDWGVAPLLYLMAYHEPLSDTKVVQLAGSINLDSGPIAAVVMDGLYMIKDPTGTLCQEEPSGTISLLDSDGRWYDLIFDGPTESQPETDMALCDGCATAWYRGKSIGEACVDFSALTSWDSNPWGY